MDDAVEHRGVVADPERRPPEGRVGRHRAEREHVDRRGRGPPFGLLGGHEPGRADPHAGPGHRGGVGRPGDPEVDHPGPVRGEQHVGRLQVTVHEAGVVNHLQRLGDARGQQQHGVGRQRPVPGDRLLQRGTGHVGGHQPGRAAIGIGVEHLGGVQPVHPPGRRDLLPEPVAELLVIAEFRPDDLQRDRPAARGEREVHPAHAAGPQPGAQPVPGDLGRVVTGQRLHVSRARPLYAPPAT